MRYRGAHCGFIMAAAFVVAGAAVAVAEQREGDSPEGRAQLSGTSLVRIDSGIEMRVLDDTVASIQADVYDTVTEVMVWTSGRISGNATVWPADASADGRYRFSVKGWDRQGALVTHQVTTKGLVDIADISFDAIPAGTKILGPNEIDLDGDVIVNATGGPGLEIEAGSATATVVRIDAPGHNDTWDALEIDMSGADDGAQAIEIQRGPSVGDRTVQINADGTAWFQDSGRVLPAFLPICFGYVASGGTVGSGSGNWSVSLEGGSSPFYVIDCPGDFSFSENTAVATVTDASSPYWAVVGFTGTNAAVTIFNSSGNRVQQDFYFVIYDNPVTEALPPVDGENEAK